MAGSGDAGVIAELEAAGVLVESARVERDRLIRAAYVAGVPVVRIAGAVGLTRQQVHRLVKD